MRRLLNSNDKWLKTMCMPPTSTTSSRHKGSLKIRTSRWQPSADPVGIMCSALSAATADLRATDGTFIRLLAPDVYSLLEFASSFILRLDRTRSRESKMIRALRRRSAMRESSWISRAVTGAARKCDTNREMRENSSFRDAFERTTHALSREQPEHDTEQTLFI